MRLNAYLVFDGHCEVAFKFYEQILGGKIEAMVSSVGTPMEQQVPPERRNKILNARLILGDAVLMGMDAPPGRYQQPKGFWVSFQVDRDAEAERIFHALAEDGREEMQWRRLREKAQLSCRSRMRERHLLFPVENK